MFYINLNIQKEDMDDNSSSTGTASPCVNTSNTAKNSSKEID